MNGIEVQIYEVLGSGERQIWEFGGADILEATTTTSLPGGFNTLDVDLTDGRFPKTLFRRHFEFAHVVCLVGGSPAFVGRLYGWTEVGPLVTGFQAFGYYFGGLDDAAFVSTDTASYTTGYVLQLVLSQAVPTLRAGSAQQWLDPQGSASPAAYSGKMPSEIVESLLSVGDGLARVTDLYVYEDQIAWLRPRIVPDKAHVLIRDDDPGLQRTPNVRDAYSSCSVDYVLVTLDGSGNEVRHPKTTARRTAPHWPYPITRNRRLHGSEMTDDEAVQYRNMMGDFLARPPVPTSISRINGDGLPTAEGGVIPPWQVRSGVQWVQVEDDPAPLPIVGTRCALVSGSLAVTCGQPIMDYYQAQADLRTVAGRARAGLDVASGGRRR